MGPEEMCGGNEERHDETRSPSVRSENRTELTNYDFIALFRYSQIQSDTVRPCIHARATRFPAPESRTSYKVTASQIHWAYEVVAIMAGVSNFHAPAHDEAAHLPLLTCNIISWTFGWRNLLALTSILSGALASTSLSKAIGPLIFRTDSLIVVPGENYLLRHAPYDGRGCGSRIQWALKNRAMIVKLMLASKLRYGGTAVK